MQKAKVLSTKVLKPHRYKNIHALGFRMLLHNLLSSQGLLQPRGNSPSTVYLTLELSSPETLESLFPNTHVTRKLIRKLICNMEGREPSLVFLPSFQITSLGLGVLMGWGGGRGSLDSQGSDSNKFSERKWGHLGTIKVNFNLERIHRVPWRSHSLGSIRMLKALFPSQGKGNHDPKLFQGYWASPTPKQEQEEKGQYQHGDQNNGGIWLYPGEHRGLGKTDGIPSRFLYQFCQ